jgi:hypothetical protein
MGTSIHALPLTAVKGMIMGYSEYWCVGCNDIHGAPFWYYSRVQPEGNAYLCGERYNILPDKAAWLPLAPGQESVGSERKTLLLGPECAGCKKSTRIVSDPASHQPQIYECITKGCVFEGMENPVIPKGARPKSHRARSRRGSRR